ncbi:Uncharacterised protein [Serratia odorifera]|uniref:Uncharacterized protein n=1 Tax=Serratia odorifera TaxID=618 RepID=A0A447KMS3_SEROD|nr:Uncharacterised protein [Serratia odorifera]
MTLQVAALLKDRDNRVAQAALRERLQRWQQNGAALQPMVAGNQLMLELGAGGAGRRDAGRHRTDAAGSLAAGQTG